MEQMTVMKKNGMLTIVLVSLFLSALFAGIATSGNNVAAETQAVGNTISPSNLDVEGSVENVDKPIDDIPVDEFGWFANKDLIGKYHWYDPAGINWLLDEAGVTGEITSISLAGDGVVAIVNGISIVLTGALLSVGPVGWLIETGVFVVTAYSSLMQQNALEKANYALSEFVANQRDYAVYETWVMWHTVPNGYEVEGW